MLYIRWSLFSTMKFFCRLLFSLDNEKAVYCYRIDFYDNWPRNIFFQSFCLETLGEAGCNSSQNSEAVCFSDRILKKKLNCILNLFWSEVCQRSRRQQNSWVNSKAIWSEFLKKYWSRLKDKDFIERFLCTDFFQDWLSM